MMGDERQIRAGCAFFWPRRASQCRSSLWISAPWRHKSEAYTAINPLQRLPALILDDGTVLTESIAICRYFETLQPQPALFGTGALEIAQVEMWQRRVELHLMVAIQAVFRHLHPGMSAAAAAADCGLGRGQQAAGHRISQCSTANCGTRRYVAGDAFSVADITGLSPSI